MLWKHRPVTVLFAALLSAQAASQEREKTFGYTSPPLHGVQIAQAKSPQAVEDALRLTRSQRRQVQRGLNFIGIDVGPADGIFGPRTRKGIRLWQSMLSQPATGYLDEKTYTNLHAAGESAPSKPHRTAPRKAGVTTATIEYGNDRYHGQTRNEEPHGRGVYTWASGNRYEGDFIDGKRTGRGVYTSAKGSRYEGDWRNGKPHGRGIFTWADGERYEGDLVNGKRQGHGVYMYSDGSRYEGQWRKGKQHGHGRYTYPGGTVKVGNWRNNNIHGHAVITFTDGERWEGGFVDGRETGRWTTTFADGDSYSREYRGDQHADIHKPSSTCLDIERSGGGLASWVNRCPVGIDVTWYDKGGCRSRAEKKFPCGWFVPANDRALAAIEGQVWWEECKSPGGHGDVLAMEKDGTVYCLDSATPRTKSRWNEHASRARGFTRNAIARANEREQRKRKRAEAEERRRRWEEDRRLDALEREQERMAAERRRRTQEAWMGVVQSLGQSLQTLETMRDHERRTSPDVECGEAGIYDSTLGRCVQNR